MASMISAPNGRKRIQFVAGDRTRKTIRLGKATRRQADGIKVKVEQLVLAATGITGVVDDETSKWLTGLDEAMYDKLAAVGLVAERKSMRLGAFLDDYIRGRHDVKAGTITMYGHTRRNLIEFFGEDKLLRDITPGDADQWRSSLLEQRLGENTARRRCGLAKQFFRAAVRRKLLSSNPFEDLKTAVKGNPQRFYFVTQREAEKVLDACPDTQWQLIFVLSRYGGLRCPSEQLALRWEDVDWDRGRILVHSPKTEHHPGGESRWIPMFPELAPHLRDAFEKAETGTTHVITRYRDSSCNLRTQLHRIIRKAGLEPWPKPFQNLRATRQTELCERWPEHVVCEWIGNSRLVARKHYLQVTDEHFEQAAKSTDPPKAAHNQAQQDAAGPCIVSHPVSENAKFNAKRAPAREYEGVMGPVGFEPTTNGL